MVKHNRMNAHRQFRLIGTVTLLGSLRVACVSGNSSFQCSATHVAQPENSSGVADMTFATTLEEPGLASTWNFALPEVQD